MSVKHLLYLIARWRKKGHLEIYTLPTRQIPSQILESPTLITFTYYLSLILVVLFYPIFFFFSSIGTTLPIRSLFSIDNSSRVVWRGIIFSILMVFAEATVGVLTLIWPGRKGLV